MTEQNKGSNSESRSETGSDYKRRSKTKGGRKRLWILAGLLAFIYFLPAIVLQTSFRQSLIDWALVDLKGRVTADNVSAGWFSPIQVSGVRVFDESGETLAEVANVAMSKTVWGLATNQTELGSIDIVGAKVYLKLRPDGSNFEDALANYLAPSEEPASPLPHLVLNVSDGEIHVASSTDTRTWLLNNLRLETELRAEQAAVIGTASMDTHAGNEFHGALEVQFGVDQGASELQANNGYCNLAAQSVPADMLVPVMQRILGPCNAKGIIDGNSSIRFSDGGNQAEINLSQFRIEQFAFVAPEYLQNDQVNLKRLAANGSLNLTAKSIQATDFEMNTDVGNVTTNGELDFAQLATLMPTGEVPTGEFRAHGELNFAAIANMLPQTLGLYEDLQVQSGNLIFDAVTRAEPGVRRLILDLDASNFTAKRGQELVSWHHPLRVTGRIAQSSEKITLESLRCESDFLTVEGSADAQVGSFTANGDLKQLQVNLAQFIDMTGIELSGKLNGEAGWSFRADASSNEINLVDRPVQIGLKFDITNPVIQMPAAPRWAPTQFSFVGNAAGKQTQSGQVTINSGGARLVVDKESIIARLAEPVSDMARAESWKWNCDIRGRTDGWLAHIRNFVWCGDFDARGRITASCVADISPSRVLLSDLEYQIDNLIFNGYGARMREEIVKGAAMLSYNFRNSLVNIPSLTWNTTSLAAHGKRLKIVVGDWIDMTGLVDFQVDMNSLTNWYGLSPKPADVNWFGVASGTVELSSDQNHIHSELSGGIVDLVAAARQQSNPEASGNFRQASMGSNWLEYFREKNVDLAGVVSIAQDFDSIQFANVQYQSPSVSLVANGSIKDLENQWQTHLTGHWNPDWNRVQGLLDAYTYETVKLVGKGEQPFSFSGPLFGDTDPAFAKAWISPLFQSQTQLAWDNGKLLTLPIGPSTMSMDVNQSVIFLNTGDIQLAEGALHLAPVIDLRREDPYLIFESGKVASDVNLSSEICRDLLKYVTPLVADATAAQGKISVHTEGIQLPLYDPVKAQARCLLQLRQGSIGAGPLTQQLVGMVNQVKQVLKPGARLSQSVGGTWIDLGDQDIPITIQDGRVYHQGIKLRVDDIIVETEGFVALDQTINLVANIPIQDEWLGDDQWLAGLKGKALQVPITGTVLKPRLDAQAIQKLTQQLVRQAAGSALNNVVQEKTGDLQNKFQQEVQNAQQKLQSEFQDKVGDELKKGLENLFKKN